MNYTIDATGKKLGRIAAEAATLLTAKNNPAYTRNTVPNVKVAITNAAKADIDDKKKEEKHYKNFSYYAGGLRETSMKRTIEKFGNKEVFRKAVYGMLPHNKLRSRIIKNLTISE